MPIDPRTHLFLLVKSCKRSPHIQLGPGVQQHPSSSQWSVGLSTRTLQPFAGGSLRSGMTSSWTLLLQLNADQSLRVML